VSSSDTHGPQFVCFNVSELQTLRIELLKRVMADAATSTQQQLQAWSQRSCCCCCGGGCWTGLVADNTQNTINETIYAQRTTARTTLQQQQNTINLLIP
jgi:hypothetical protein